MPAAQSSGSLQAEHTFERQLSMKPGQPFPSWQGRTQIAAEGLQTYPLVQPTAPRHATHRFVVGSHAGVAAPQSAICVLPCQDGNGCPGFVVGGAVKGRQFYGRAPVTGKRDGDELAARYQRAQDRGCLHGSSTSVSASARPKPMGKRCRYSPATSRAAARSVVESQRIF